MLVTSPATIETDGLASAERLAEALAGTLTRATTSDPPTRANLQKKEEEESESCGR